MDELRELLDVLTDVGPKPLFISCGLLLVAWKVIQLMHSTVQKWSNDKIRSSAQKELKQKMVNWTHQVIHQVTEEQAWKIIKLSFKELQTALEDGHVTAVQVLHAYQYRAAKLNEDINFICEPIMEAQDVAEKLDMLESAEKKSLPLFGLPISVKENYHIEGYHVTVGCTNFLKKPPKETSYVIKALMAQGAVPFIRTNIPQTCMAFDSINPIYGATVNPHNKIRSCGGSSGGEGAGIGGCASILGFGSDIGGSVRIPAAWCGCYALKPTSDRLSHYGDAGVDFNERIICVTCGPLARDTDAVIASLRCLTSESAYHIDPYIPPLKFDEQELNSKAKLRIGYYHTIGFIETCQASRRSVDIAINALKSAGHELVEWTPPEFERALSVLTAKDLFADGGQLLCDSVKYDRLSPSIAETIYGYSIPKLIRRFLGGYLLRPFFPRYLCAYLESSCGTDSVAEFWELEDQIKKYRREVLKDLKSQGIDALICPAMPNPAMKIGECKDALGVMVYMGYFNLLNFPCGIVPVCKVTSDDIETDMKEFPAKDMWHKAMKKNLKESEGLPMAVQCVSLPFRDEQCLRLMKELEAAVGYDVLTNMTNLKD